MELAESNKLQAYKSSFQAWKCASLGYALVALLLLGSKWHQVSTNLGLLAGIEQLVWAQSGLSTSLAAPLNSSQAQPTGGQQQQQPVSQLLGLESLLLLSNLSQAARQDETSGSEPASRSPSSPPVATQHIQLAFGRELTGSELLKRELEAFLGELRSAKSTLGLSTLLVLIYIVSWMLMTLAVNDTKISNDVSLRNILLLSVFGAIDLAASSGFVMVRLIMFNVKNGNFLLEMLGSSGLRENAVRLSADQLTAFAALRLVAIQSCSAHVDLYVSVLVGLLTLLRLYAIMRALAYYKFLKRYQDLQRALSFNQQQQLIQRPSASLAAADEQPLVGYSSSDSSSSFAPKPAVWPPPFAASHSHQQHHQQRARLEPPRQVRRNAPAQLQQAMVELRPEVEPLSGEPSATSVADESAGLNSQQQQQQEKSSPNNSELEQQQQQVLARPVNARRLQLQQELNSLLLEQKQQQWLGLAANSTPCAIKLSSATLAAKRLQLASSPRLLASEAEPRAGPQSEHRAETGQQQVVSAGHSWWPASGRTRDPNNNNFQPESSQRVKPPPPPQPASFTLLSARQLERLSRRLIESASLAAAAASSSQLSSHLATSPKQAKQSARLTGNSRTYRLATATTTATTGGEPMLGQARARLQRAEPPQAPSSSATDTSSGATSSSEHDSETLASKALETGKLQRRLRASEELVHLRSSRPKLECE